MRWWSEGDSSRPQFQLWMNESARNGEGDDEFCLVSWRSTPGSGKGCHFSPGLDILVAACWTGLVHIGGSNGRRSIHLKLKANPFLAQRHEAHRWLITRELVLVKSQNTEIENTNYDTVVASACWLLLQSCRRESIYYSPRLAINSVPPARAQA